MDAAQNEDGSNSASSENPESSAADLGEQAAFVDWGSSDSLTSSGHMRSENEGK